MVFIVAQARCGAKVLKSWYDCVINDSSMLSYVYNDFSNGTLDDGPVIPENYQAAAVPAYIGRTKTSLTRVSSQCPVGEVVSALGKFVEFLLSKATNESDGLTMESVNSKVNAFSC